MEQEDDPRTPHDDEEERQDYRREHDRSPTGRQRLWLHSDESHTLPLSSRAGL